MNESFNRKYKKVLEILPDVAECAQGKLILVGGTALALFYLKHRVSVDLDFVPVSGDEIKLKEELKGCLSKKGYRTMPGAFKNQFVIQFEDTSIKVEVFEPGWKIKCIEEHVFSGISIKVASLSDILEMKQDAYSDRKEARDLFDIFCILKGKGGSAMVKKLITKSGPPKGIEDIGAMALNQEDAAAFQKVVSDAS
ncbi:nucleotidyl transferase AbiEii/AbiGii toxin family protein [Candidatus Micrarchaeota archaeon]|nr:nucleotidyl transferase AbiEii/AbiGii toxin family protein [Candidatus Micrarchaeota archaeon]